MRLLVTLLVTISLNSPANESTIDECQGQANNYCFAQRAHAYEDEQEKKLNSAYKALLHDIKKYDDGFRRMKSIESSQRAWISFRKSTCDFVQMIADRSGSDCWGNLAKIRAKETPNK
jgi:uncharacterized protein YecT (DUF1311 family)